jgi:DNA mismatch repair protein MutH
LPYTIDTSRRIALLQSSSGYRAEREETMQSIDERLKTDPTVRKVVAQGYEISYNFRPDGHYLDLGVTLNCLPVAQATFAVITPKAEIQNEHVHTNGRHRRHGLANAMYVCAEKITGFRIVPASNQTDDGRALWQQSKRPWGLLSTGDVVPR